MTALAPRVTVLALAAATLVTGLVLLVAKTGAGTVGAVALVASVPAALVLAAAYRNPVIALAGVPVLFVVGTFELPAGLHAVHVVVLAAVLLVAVGIRSPATGPPALVGGPPRAGTRGGIPAVLVAAGVLVAAAFASTAAGAVDAGGALRLAGSYLLGWLYAIAVWAGCRSAADPFRLLVAGATGTGAVCLTGLGGLSGLQAHYGGAVIVNRPTGVLAQPNELGLMAAVTLLLGLAALATGRRLPGRHRTAVAVGAAAALAGAAALAASLSRGGWIGAALGLVALFLLGSGLRRTLARAVLGGAAVLGVAVALLPGLGLGQIATARLGSVFMPGANPFDQRPEVWRAALHLISRFPLLGVGPGGFPSVALDDPVLGTAEGVPEHAHDLVLTVGVEQGLIGVGALVVTVALAIARTHRALRARPGPLVTGPTAGCVAALVAVLGQGVVDYPLRDPVLAVLVWLLVGLLVAATGRRDTTGGDGRPR